MITVPNTIDEIAKLPPVVAMDIFRTVLNMLGEVGTLEDLKSLKKFEFDYWFGGTPCIVETYEDLKQINVLVHNQTENRWCNVTEAVGDMDIAEFLTPEWIFLLLCTNNSGGVGYYIPARFAEQCPNLLKIIALHNEGSAGTPTLES